jgi:hypothetical protein
MSPATVQAATNVRNAPDVAQVRASHLLPPEGVEGLHMPRRGYSSSRRISSISPDSALTTTTVTSSSVPSAATVESETAQ